MLLIPVKTKLIKPSDDLINVILSSLKKNKLNLKDRDILFIASKVVSIVEGRIINLKDVTASLKAKEIAKEIDLDERQVELILNHSEKVYGKVYKALLTLRNNFLIANAGIDKSNWKIDEVVLWPSNPQKSAEKIRDEIFKRTKKRVGIVIVDSRTTPLRWGTIGLALAVAGFHPVKDYRFKKDIFGNALQITIQNLADDLACAAHALMGEANEKTPIVLARNTPVKFSAKINAESAFIPPDKCLYMKILNENLKSR
ncbi:coenzyme F420-0:L-glutamate ligase [Candidatus Bathyarchaeota archaeon]|nr:coenzyme F420-0:L-glutamate ligase [Candidatus Bathyarchaeota archaeon]